ncbi:MAG: hypothetical protein A2600_08600 [Candidatus Lambdaproteobacteria bacterium RIFOXYD1_FULL_56_27]|uniref:Uncharacterized protein n=1 Tax=Candidatus Lambdaproteobacteria bacterium RIFOXYD2_FULL_56_26 TaxID=1817773 RepID=A0A1F6GZ27_9PROT|nr:MAG: hypothetical protein A2426_10020 [Candidatus Lambdaproteobacteria bacterium RIFOXYC1_FULL_56_13]OGH03405.1 MAG: hypothetical protein A2557_02665 [Candidatus Lambdaproteobacteria bacterium RIFOXYD2_FULL_56_26]OGH06590.1 MAG: hypothetical protein A2600_08600 [Candidatus Lambdaproteobacteria bacterium RIFOXYD1_FULL_56_27]
MALKIGLITQTRQAEAMRMALGLLLLGDEAEVFFPQCLPAQDEMAVIQRKNALEMEVPLHFDHPQAPEELRLSPEAFTEALLQFDRLIPL